MLYCTVFAIVDGNEEDLIEFINGNPTMHERFVHAANAGCCWTFVLSRGFFNNTSEGFLDKLTSLNIIKNINEFCKTHSCKACVVMQVGNNPPIHFAMYGDDRDGFCHPIMQSGQSITPNIR